jgi:hypothetical protein
MNHELTYKFVSGIILMLGVLGLWATFFKPSSLRFMKWGRFGGGFSMSRLGHFAWSFLFAVIGLSGLFHGAPANPNSSFLVMACLIFVVSLVIFAAFYDWRLAIKKRKK